MNGTVLKYLPIGLVLALVAGGVGYGTTRAQVNQNAKDIQSNREGVTRIYPRLTGIEINQATQEERAEQRYLQQKEALEQQTRQLEEIKRLLQQR